MKKLLLVLIGTIISLSLVGCGSHEHPTGDHPTSDHPDSEHPE